MEIYQSFWILRCANALHNNYTVLFLGILLDLFDFTVHKCITKQLHRIIPDKYMEICRFYGVVETFSYHAPQSNKTTV